MKRRLVSRPRYCYWPVTHSIHDTDKTQRFLTGCLELMNRVRSDVNTVESADLVGVLPQNSGSRAPYDDYCMGMLVLFQCRVTTGRNFEVLGNKRETIFARALPLP